MAGACRFRRREHGTRDRTGSRPIEPPNTRKRTKKGSAVARGDKSDRNRCGPTSVPSGRQEESDGTRVDPSTASQEDALARARGSERSLSSRGELRHSRPHAAGRSGKEAQYWDTEPQQTSKGDLTRTRHIKVWYQFREAAQGYTGAGATRKALESSTRIWGIPVITEIGVRTRTGDAKLGRGLASPPIGCRGGPSSALEHLVLTLKKIPLEHFVLTLRNPGK